MKRMKDRNRVEFYISKYNLGDIIDDELKELFEIHSFNKRDLIYELGKEPEYLYILVEGTIKVYTTSQEGKNLALRMLTPITNLGDIEIMTETASRCNVEAMTSCICLSISMTNAKNIGLNKNKFLRYLSKDLCHKFDDITSISSNNLLYPLRNRLANYLIAYIDPKDNIVKFPYSHTEIAELLVTTYRHLTRSLKELERLGVIKIIDKRIHVIDHEELDLLSVEVFPHKN